MVPDRVGPGATEARGRRVRRARPARRGAARADPDDRPDVVDRRPAAGRDRLVLAPDEPGPGAPRGPCRSRHPRPLETRRQPPRLRPRRAPLPERRSGSRGSNPGAVPAQAPVALPGARPARHEWLGRALVGNLAARRAGVRGRPADQERRASRLARRARRVRDARAGRGRRHSRPAVRPGRRAANLARAEREVAAGEPPGEAAPGVAFLAALDPLVWDRDLLRSLYDFDYTWEVYVPAAKRRWGYYVLPILFGDRLVGRIEPRIERKANELRIAGLWWEEGFDPLGTPGFVEAFQEALEAHRAFGGVARVAWPRVARHRALIRAVRTQGAGLGT
ncbi:MAG: crosslink repair DNA glycosylase YcaQ family protein [Gaiellaceae bacterium]